MQEQETVKLSERALSEADPNLEARLKSLLRLGQEFEDFLRSDDLLKEDSFIVAAFNLMQSCCRLTNAAGASLYSSKREGYLDRQAFCSDPDLSHEQIRSASQVTEHVAVGQGIAGYLALAPGERKQFDYKLKYPIRSSAAIEVWDIGVVEELPEKLHCINTQLLAQRVIDISSMFLVKEVGINGVDLILQLVRKTENGFFSNWDKLIAELFARLIFSHFRNIELYRKNTAALSSSPVSASHTTSELHTPVQQIVADAYDAIQAIMAAAIDKLEKTGANR